MHRTHKPVHKCYSCLLNLGDHCWEYEYPCDQWGSKRRCPGNDNEELHAKYREWASTPHVKTRKELRRDLFHHERHNEEHHNHFGGGRI